MFDVGRSFFSNPISDLKNMLSLRVLVLRGKIVILNVIIMVQGLNIYGWDNFER